MLTTFCTRWLKSSWVGGFGGSAGLTRVTGAALAVAIACGGGSSPLGGATTGTFLGASGPAALIVGTVFAGGRVGGMSGGACTGTVLGGTYGGTSGTRTGAWLGGGSARRGGADWEHTLDV